MEEHEQSCKQRASPEPRYSRVIFSRLEAAWVVPHPPLSLLNPDVLWVQARQGRPGLNDRYALMSRDHASVYFGRWKLLLSRHLFSRLTQPDVLTSIPEVFLQKVLEAHRIPVGTVPALSWLPCCVTPGVCFMKLDCFEQPLMPGPLCESTKWIEFDPRRLKVRSSFAWSFSSWRSSHAVGALRENGAGDRAEAGGAGSSVGGASNKSVLPIEQSRNLAERCLLVRGKYDVEVFEVSRLFQMMQCPNAFWMAKASSVRSEAGGEVYTNSLEAVVMIDELVYVPARRLTAYTRVMLAADIGVLTTKDDAQSGASSRLLTICHASRGTRRRASHADPSSPPPVQATRSQQRHSDTLLHVFLSYAPPRVRTAANKPLLHVDDSGEKARAEGAKGNQTLLQRIEALRYMRPVAEACVVRSTQPVSTAALPRRGMCIAVWIALLHAFLTTFAAPSDSYVASHLRYRAIGLSSCMHASREQRRGDAFWLVSMLPRAVLRLEAHAKASLLSRSNLRMVASSMVIMCSA
eukprot:4499312-Pleurochrysis_carterae.AAC.5